MSHSLPSPSTRPRAGRRLGLFQLAEVPLLLLLLFLLAMVREARGECPKLCECKWRDGKETVSCPGASFIDIPRRLDQSTQVLDLTRNNLQILPRYAFQDAALLNLQKVWLPFCNLKQLQLGSFKGLSNLVELDLSDNLLKKIPIGALQDVEGLRELRIGRNRLSTLPSAAFSVIPDLIKLDLSENMISDIVQDAFKGLSRLEVLRLGGNRLSTLTVETLNPLVSLHGLHLHENPWRCNCHLRPLRKWMLTKNVAEHVQPTCSLPVRLHGREWQSLTLDEFVCMPSVTAVAPRVLAAHGDNVSLACKVETDLDASVTWLVGDRLLENATETGGRRYRVQELVAPDHNTRLSNLTIAGAAIQDQGTYRCVAENKAGRVETNLTLQVSKEILEVPLVAIDKVFMAGAVLGGGGFLIAVLALLYAVFFRRRNLRRRQRRAKEELQSTLTSAGSLSGTHSSSRIHLNSIGALHDEDEGQSIALTEMRKHPKLSDYHIVATSEVDSSPMLPEASSKPWVVRDSSLDDFVLSKDMDKVYSDKDADRLCEQHKDFEHRKSSATSSASPRKVSYIEIPKPELARDNVDEKAKWKDIAYQSKEVALKRDLLRQQSPQQAQEGSFLRQEGVGGGSGSNGPPLKTNSTGGSANFPDLLDLPQTQTQAQQSQVEGKKVEGATPSYNNFPPLVPRRQRPLSDAAVLPRREDVQRRYLEGLGIPPGQAIGEEQRSTSTLALPQLSGTAPGAALGECPEPGASTKDGSPTPHRPLLRRHPSLPTSPLFEDAQALRELLATHRADYLAESSRNLDPADPYRYEYHAAQLDKFLQEYKNLQEQLYRMKESCEHMKKSGAAPRTDGEGATGAATTSDPSLEASQALFDLKDLTTGGAATADSSNGVVLRGNEGGKGEGGNGVRGVVGGTVGGSLRPSGSGEPLKSILKNRNEGVGVYHLGNFGDDRTPLESAEEATAGFSREDSGIKHQDFEFYNS